MTQSPDSEKRSRRDPVSPDDLPRSVLDDLLEGCQVIGPDYCYLYVNHAVAAQGRTTRENLVGRTMQAVYPDIEATAMFAVLRQSMEKRISQKMENEFVFPDGSSGWFELRFEPVPAGVAVFSVEITERRRVEAVLHRTQRAFRTLSKCNQTLVRASDEDRFLRDVCALAVEHGYRLAWIGFKESDAARSVRPVAAAGVDEGYTTALQVTWGDDARGHGPTGRAIRTGETAVARFIATDPEFAPWNAAALLRGFLSSVALPFRVDGEVAGALNLYAAEPDAFDGEELKLLEEMALDLGYGIATLRARVAHQLAQESTRASAQRWSGTFNAISDTVCVISTNHEFVEINDAGCAAIGRPREEIIGRKCFDLLHGTDIPIMACPCSQVGQALKPAVGMLEQGDRCYELLAWPILGSDRRLEGFVHIVKDITERKRVEQALRENEARFRAVFEVTSVGIVQVDPRDGRIGRYNEKYREITGYSDEELRAMQFRELTHPDDRERDWELFSRAVRGETPDYRNEKRYVRKDGSIVWVRLNASFVRDSAGKPLRTVAICEDITESKRAEVALRESEERYRMLFENSLDAVLLTVPDGSVLSANPAACHMFGRTEAEIHTLGRDAILDPKDPRLVGLLATRARDGKAFGELAFFRKDGSSFPGEVSSVLFEERSGSVRSSMIIRDITERKLAEIALRQSEGKFRTIFEASASAMAIIERDKMISMVNREFSKLSLYEEADVIGQSWLTLIPPEDLGRLQEYNSRRLIDPKSAPDQYEFTFYRKDGAVRNCLMSVGVIPTSNQIICSFVDITERKRAEAKRLELEEQLRGAQKMEAIGRLAGGVAHDFNNLLAVIISYAEFTIEQLRESDPVRSDIKEICKAGHRAAVLTRQLLAFGRKQMLAPEVLSLNDVVTDIESMLTRLLGEDVDVATYLAEDLGNVTADRGQIEQVLMNLAVNSRDAMPEGGKLTIETANVELDENYAERHVAVVPGRYVLLSVTDTGCGMDAETQSRVFEPFFTTKERGKGTGLGLSTAYGIVKQSGGNIWIYSVPGQGTTFKVYLPRVNALAVEAALKPVSEAPTGSETVLVVEDEDAVRRLTERILRTAGYRVLAASNGGEALLLCEKHGDAIDLLLTDVVMPQMGGRELSDRLAKLSPGLRVLFTSGYTDEAIVHHGALDQGTNFIGKPFSAAALTRKVRAVLDEPGPEAKL